MNCPKCNREVYRITTLYKQDKKIEGCISCLATSITPISTTYITDSTLSSMTHKYVTVAHRDDIERRHVDIKTGEIYRGSKR